MLILSLALRYATRRLVNYVAVAAIAVALTVQIVAGGILDGMIVGFKKRVRGVGEQVTIRFGHAPLPRAAFETVSEELRLAHAGELLDATPFLSEWALVRPLGGNGSAHRFGEVWSVDLGRELAHSSLARQILDFKLDPKDPSWFAPGDPPKGRTPMLMGASLADALGVKAGDEIEIVHARRRPNGEYEPVTAKFILTSRYRTGSMRRDEAGVYIPLSAGVPFFLDAPVPAGTPAGIPEMVCWLRDPEQAARLEPLLRQTVEDSLRAHRWDSTPAERPGMVYPRRITSDNWQERWSGVIAAMRNENNLVELVLALYMFSGGFCVFAILSTLAGRRVRDVGLLRCLGAGRGTIAAVFLLVGMLLGTAGAALGTGAGLWFLSPNGKGDPRPRVDVYYTKVTGQSMYPPEVYGATEDGAMSVVVSYSKIGLYAAGALLVTLLSALYPALWAATREPVAALRDEG